jgi:hypothetical protein
MINNLPKIKDINIVNIDTDKLLNDFHIIAQKDKNNRIKLEKMTDIKCSYPGCMKYATYKKVSTNIYLCWLHCYIEKN